MTAIRQTTRTRLAGGHVTGSYPDDGVGQEGQFGHGAAREGDSGHRSQSEEQPDLAGELWQRGERHECWKRRED